MKKNKKKLIKLISGSRYMVMRLELKLFDCVLPVRCDHSGMKEEAELCSRFSVFPDGKKHTRWDLFVFFFFFFIVTTETLHLSAEELVFSHNSTPSSHCVTEAAFMAYKFHREICPGGWTAH